ncbi:ThuA domain-containing protein [Planctomicrobium sp. SH661]|uniref:ThuA domain-containing protein n=1 Tax=Planctomicrobium sp. SH661 TaxID=3448124 RepID=UPI003F5B3B4F
MPGSGIETFGVRQTRIAFQKFVSQILLSVLFCCLIVKCSFSAEPPRKIVLIAGPKSHGPVGNGIHDYPWSVKLLKVMLDNSNISKDVKVEYHLDGWPEDPRTLDDAATIMVVSDGRDGDLFAEAPHFSSQEHRDQIARQIQRGCGFVTFHFSTFAPDSRADDILDWSGAYFDWETDGKRDWYSAIQTADTDILLPSPDHPVARGVQPFRMQEEFYFNLRFREGEMATQPVLEVPALPGREEQGKVVAWARQRPNGGRGFGTTCGHFYSNWKQLEFRKLILNALAWTAQLEVPAQGVESRYFTHEEVTSALAGMDETGRAIVEDHDKPIRVLVLSGAHHPGHLWKQTSPQLKELLEQDPRIQVDISDNIEDLATPQLRDYDVLIQNYCNWMQPGLSEQAKTGFLQYLQEGGGLVIVHFANGAFHFSLPEVGDSDWPEYRNICRRVWDHTAGRSGHDAFGKFMVEIDDHDHPITQGMEAFETIDELYFRQQGELPIHVLASAKSEVTGQLEPMAFVYDYGQARIFQTVLGHAVESLRTEGTATLLRRATAWAAHRKPQDPAAVNQKNESGVPLTKGRFGEGLDASQDGVLVPERDEYARPPLTVEFWTKLTNADSYNILIANEDKTSATHWELFTVPGTGLLCAYLPGQDPAHVNSQFNLCDGQWHQLGMIYEPQRVRLYVDTQLVADQAIRFQNGTARPGPLGIGTLVDRQLRCAGTIDSVRISQGVREITPMDREYPRDDATIDLWQFNAGDRFETVRLDTPAEKKDHWGKEAVGFDWKEGDSVDSRWNQMQVGPFLASTLFLPGQPPVAKGLSIRIGDEQQAAVCFDTDRAEFRGVWTGPFLNFNPTRFGLTDSPEVAGELLFTSEPIADSELKKSQFRGLRRHGSRVVLEYTLGETTVAETPWWEHLGSRDVLTRTLELSPSHESTLVPVLSGHHLSQVKLQDEFTCAVIHTPSRCLAVAVRGAGKPQLKLVSNNSLILDAPAGNQPRQLQLIYWSGPEGEVQDFLKSLKSLPEPESLSQLQTPGPSQWNAEIETTGTLSSDAGPYVLDTLTLPFENPYRALLFLSGHDFFSNGDIAVSTVHGDVWRVSGVDETLQKLKWKRYATGLFQPLGLKIVDDQVYVLGRDQITRLHDDNNDQEADRYECFYNGYLTSPNGHDYVACLETDSKGNFYVAHANEGVIRVHHDGSGHEVVATGLRNPNGLSVGPGDVITTAPQEGNWTPASAIFEVRPGNYFGYGGPRESPERPLGYDPPLCWIPRLVDNSTGGQAWVTSDRWGPLQGQLLSFSFGKCRMMLVLRELINGGTQGGTVNFPFDFDSGVMRGRFSPSDGQLYVSGLRGWVSAAVLDGCLQRVRYTGTPVDLPVAVKTYRNGLAVTYSQQLDRSSIHPDRVQVQQWNYRYAVDYGSPEYRVKGTLEEGRDEVPVSSVTLLDDGRTLFLEMDSLQPVMQMNLQLSLVAADGTPIKSDISYTLNSIGEEAMDSSLLAGPGSSARVHSELEAHLQPGLEVKYSQSGREVVRTLRLAALHVDKEEVCAGGLQPGPFAATMRGILTVPSTGNYSFRIAGAGTAVLSIDEAAVASLPSASDAASMELELLRGSHRIQVQYESPPEGAATLQVLWSGTDFAEEPIPPVLLRHDGRNPKLLEAQQRLLGQSLVESHRCLKCHEVTPSSFAKLHASRLPDTPDLKNLGNRVRADWIANWLMNPQQLRNQAAMPVLFHGDSSSDRQAAADLAVWLTGTSNAFVSTTPTDSITSAGQGEELYATLGCYACHRMTPPQAEDDFNRISLHFVAQKFAPGKLAEFLRQPQAHFRSIPMPDFHLSESEAQALASYLKSAAPGELLPFPELASADAERGNQAWKTRGCMNCHAQDDNPKTTQPKLPLTLRAPGCLSESTLPNDRHPRYSLSESERSAVKSYLTAALTGEHSESKVEASSRLFTSLRCNACHSRDSSNSPRAAIFVEEFDTGFLPETIPSLTWAGDKLYADWTAAFLSGSVSSKPRPTLKARMPSFPAFAQVLATGFAAEHGLSEEASSHSYDPKLVAIGNELTRKSSGLDCRQCHGVGSEQAVGDGQTQLALGINFVDVRERIRPEFYRRFVLDPPRFDVSTKMPRLAADGLTTKIRTHYDGDAQKQFEAIWNFIQSLPAEPASESPVSATR